VTGEPLLAPEIAEITGVPDWIAAYASGTPWPIHSAVYTEAMAEGGIGIEGAADTWEGFLAQIGQMEFMGHTVVGHTTFLRRLDIAQRHLRRNIPDLRESRMVSSVGSPGDRSQWRAAERLTASPHLFGMAVDINAGQNPWMNDPEAVEDNTRYSWIIWRACWLLGRASPVTAAESHRQAQEGQTTEQIWTYFNEADEAAMEYLGLTGNRERVEDLLRSLGAAPAPPGPVQKPGGVEMVGDYFPPEIPQSDLARGAEAVDQWLSVIDSDRAAWPRRARGDTPAGFMNLDLELVRALRDAGELQWGASDLGEYESGDMMHFALDPPRFFRFRNQVRQALRAQRAEMGDAAYREAQREERARRAEMAAHP
jgi:hypothetical protein